MYTSIFNACMKTFLPTLFAPYFDRIWLAGRWFEFSLSNAFWAIWNCKLSDPPRICDRHGPGGFVWWTTAPNVYGFLVRFPCLNIWTMNTAKRGIRTTHRHCIFTPARILYLKGANGATVRPQLPSIELLWSSSHNSVRILSIHDFSQRTAQR